MCKTNIKRIVLLFVIAVFLIFSTLTGCKLPLKPTPEITGIIYGIVGDLPKNNLNYSQISQLYSSIYLNQAQKESLVSSEGYLPVSNALVTVTDSQGITHHTYTNSEGYYQFEKLTVNANTIIKMVKETTNGVKIYKDLIMSDISPEESYYLGVTSALETARVLVVEALIEWGKKIEHIKLEDIDTNKYFPKLVDLINQAQLKEEDFVENDLILKQINLIVKSLIYLTNPPSSPQTPEPPIPPSPPLSSDKDFLSYQFLAADNETLSSDIIGIIMTETHLIELTVPFATDLTKLIATFELSPSASAYLNEIVQESGVTPNNFTNSLTYTIIAEDGSKQDWQVVVDQEIGPLHYFTITGFPDLCIAGDNFGNHDLTVIAYDRNNREKYDFRGEVYFIATDNKAKLPYTITQKYTFTEEDQGIHVFPADGFSFETAGEQIITITDGEISAETEPIMILAAALERFQIERIANQKVGVPFTITIIAKDRFWNTVLDYDGINTLNDSTTTISPKTTGNFVDGLWSGEVTISFPQNNVQITTRGNGKTGYSNLFHVSQ